MDLKEFVNKKYLEFSNYEGSQHIASEFAIYKIITLIAKFEIRSILEVGLGIGSIASSILDYDSSINYKGTEANAFCLRSLSNNLKEKYDIIDIVPSLDVVMIDKKIDLIIVDGAYNNLIKLKDKLSKHAIFCIEGDRKNQAKDIQSIFPKALGVHVISMDKNNSKGVFDKAAYQGGLKVFFVNPTLRQRLYWLSEKLNTRKVYKKRQQRTVMS
jgi:hypothetical protein